MCRMYAYTDLTATDNPCEFYLPSLPFSRDFLSFVVEDVQYSRQYVFISNRFARHSASESA